MDVIIFSGQSNMQGQTEAPMSSEPIVGAREYRYLSNTILPLAHPVGEDILSEDGKDYWLLGAHQGYGSLIPDFCRSYIEKTGNEVLAVHAAKGATMVCQWLPETLRYRMLIRKVRGAVAACATPPEHVWFVWLQGESDAIAACTADEYGRQMKRLREALISDLSIDAFGIIRVGKFVGDDRDLAIITAQEMLCQTEDFVMLTRMTGYCTQSPDYLNPFEAGHYNNAAMTRIGQAAGEQLGRLCCGEALCLENEPYKELAGVY